MRKIKLKELASYNKGQQINGNMLLNEGKYEYLNGGINPSGKWNEYNVEGNTIAISEGGNSCGYVNYMNRNFWCGAHCYYLFNIKCNVKYLFYNLKYNERRLQNIRSGACMPNIKKKELGEFEIFIDEDIKIQNKIASYLDRISYIMQNRKKQIEELDELIKSQFVEMFGDPIDNPKNNKIVKLSDIAEYWNGLTYKPTDVSKEGTIVLRSSNIQNSQLDFEDVVRVNCNIKEKQFVKENDILMCSRNGSARLVGKVAVIQDIKEEMTFGAFMMIIRSIYYPYLFSYFQTDAFRSQIKSGATTTINQITGNMLNKIKLPLPDIEEINKFADFVKQIDKQKFEVQKSLEEIQKLQESLMNKYFGD